MRLNVRPRSELSCSDVTPERSTSHEAVCVDLKPRPHQQQCPSNIVECYKLNDSFEMSNVASTVLLVWTGPYRTRIKSVDPA